MSRLGKTRLTESERRMQLMELCAARPRTVVELAHAMQCSDGLVRYYLKQLPMHVTPRPQPPQRPVLEFSYHEQEGGAP